MTGCRNSLWLATAYKPFGYPLNHVDQSLGALTRGLDLRNLGFFGIAFQDMRPWRNWQTRETKDLVPVLGRAGSIPVGRIWILYTIPVQVPLFSADLYSQAWFVAHRGDTSASFWLSL